MNKEKKQAAGWASEEQSPDDVESTEDTGATGEVEEEITALNFETNGWCPELKKSYRKGTYTPKTLAEFKALKKYAIPEKE